MKKLASSFKTQGGTIKNRKAMTDIREDGTNDTTVWALLDDDTHISADEIVIAARAHSAHLVLSAMGQFYPLETEGRYSVTFSKNSNLLLTRAICDPSAGWIATLMSGGLRVAEKVELGGVNLLPTPAQWSQIKRETQTLLGDEALSKRILSKDWLGFYPTMPDAMPVISH